jgi:hypothetical protein
MKTDELTNEQRLALIADMIGQAKKNVAKGGSFYFLLWGVVVATANFGHYVMEAYSLYDRPYMIWLITIPASIASIVYSIRQDRQALVSTQLDRLYGQLWIAIFVVIVILLAHMPQLDFQHNAIILALCGLGTFMNGAMLRFTPLILGGVALWVGAIVAFRADVTDQYLVAGVAIVIGYLVPGFLLRQAEK